MYNYKRLRKCLKCLSLIIILTYIMLFIYNKKSTKIDDEIFRLYNRKKFLLLRNLSESSSENNNYYSSKNHEDPDNNEYHLRVDKKKRKSYIPDTIYCNDSDESSTKKQKNANLQVSKDISGQNIYDNNEISDSESDIINIEYVIPKDRVDYLVQDIKNENYQNIIEYNKFMKDYRFDKFIAKRMCCCDGYKLCKNSSEFVSITMVNIFTDGIGKMQSNSLLTKLSKYISTNLQNKNEKVILENEKKLYNIVTTEKVWYDFFRDSFKTYMNTYYYQQGLYIIQNLYSYILVNYLMLVNIKIKINLIEEIINLALDIFYYNKDSLYPDNFYEEMRVYLKSEYEEIYNKYNDVILDDLNLKEIIEKCNELYVQICKYCYLDINYNFFNEIDANFLKKMLLHRDLLYLNIIIDENSYSFQIEYANYIVSCLNKIYSDEKAKVERNSMNSSNQNYESDYYVNEFIICLNFTHITLHEKYAMLKFPSKYFRH